MKNTTILVFALILLIIIGGFIFLKTNLNGETVKNSVNSGKNNVQKITLSMKNYNYYPNTITVKANQPVSIILDNSIGGCYRGFVIRDLGVQKYSQNPGDTIDFTPTQKGTFRFSCSMGMGTGTIIVE